MMAQWEKLQPYLQQASLQVQQHLGRARLGSGAAAVPTPVGLQGGAAGEGAQQRTAPLLQPSPHRRILELQEQGGGLDGVWQGGGEGKEEVVVVLSE